jgi:periplasmic protein TonB
VSNLSLTKLYFECTRTSKAPVAWFLLAVAIHVGLVCSPIGNWLRSPQQITFKLGDAGVEVEFVSDESAIPLAENAPQPPAPAVENTPVISETDSNLSVAKVENGSQRKSTTTARATTQSNDQTSGHSPRAGSAVAQPAAEIYAPQPPYPPIARELGLEGNVRLRVRVGIDGCARAVKIARSSGRFDFNSASITTVKRDWRFRPARAATGAPVESTILVAIRFILKSG